MKYIIGIDSGATKSELVIVPFAGSIQPELSGWKSLRMAPVNYNLLGLEGTATRLKDIIKQATKRLKLNDVVYIGIGISGARHLADRAKLEEKISKALKFRNIKIYPDTEIAFASIFDSKEKNCGILIAGTGSVLYYKDSKGKLKRVGGWGRLIGDAGSGHWIAQEALKKVTEHFDIIGPYTAILKAIRKEFGIYSHNLLEHVYHNEFEISRITPLVFKCAVKRDKAAIEIIKHAAEKLAKHFEALGKTKAKVALVGSLFTEEKLLEKYLRDIAKKKYPRVEFLKPIQSPVWGAVKLAEIASEAKQSRF